MSLARRKGGSLSPSPEVDDADSDYDDERGPCPTRCMSPAVSRRPGSAAERAVLRRGRIWELFGLSHAPSEAVRARFSRMLLAFSPLPQLRQRGVFEEPDVSSLHFSWRPRRKPPSRRRRRGDALEAGDRDGHDGDGAWERGSGSDGGDAPRLRAHLEHPGWARERARDLERVNTELENARKDGLVDRLVERSSVLGAEAVRCTGVNDIAADGGDAFRQVGGAATVARQCAPLREALRRASEAGDAPACYEVSMALAGALAPVDPGEAERCAGHALALAKGPGRGDPVLVAAALSRIATVQFVHQSWVKAIANDTRAIDVCVAAASAWGGEGIRADRGASPVRDDAVAAVTAGADAARRPEPALHLHAIAMYNLAAAHLRLNYIDKAAGFFSRARLMFEFLDCAPFASLAMRGRDMSRIAIRVRDETRLERDRVAARAAEAARHHRPVV